VSRTANHEDPKNTKITKKDARLTTEATEHAEMCV
jgi:hypothetical protein